MRPQQVLPLKIKVDLGIMAMKGYSTLPRSPELEPHHQMLFSIIPGSPIFCRGQGFDSSADNTEYSKPKAK